MAVKAVLMSTSDDPRKVGKSLSKLAEVSMQLKDDTDIIDPIFKISYEGMASIKKCNYLYCSTFGRYYFINDIVGCVGGYYELICHVDVLQSYRDQIKNINTFIVRQEKSYNPYITDEQRPVRVPRLIDKLNIGRVGSVSDNYYYLTVNNGGED